nr:cobaltochelatase subunit CobN [Desulfosoma caldarium]
MESDAYHARLGCYRCGDRRLLYERFAAKCTLHAKMKRWLKEVNPCALQNILVKLLEAVEQGLWQASAELVERLREAYLDVEGVIEEATAWT